MPIIHLWKGKFCKMGFGDFSLQNNNGDKKLNEIKHGVRRDQIEAKFRNIFDIYDVNKDGTLESRELSELEKSLQDFAGEDKVLTEGENKVALTIFTSITGVKNVDISGFLKNLSDASELIESTSQTLGEDGGNIITTKYKDGGTEVIAYYPDGEYKFKKIDINTTSTKYYYTIGTNLNKKFTAEDIENAVKKAGSQTALAAARGMTQSQISDYLRGRFFIENITIGALYKLFPDAKIDLNVDREIEQAEPLAISLEEQLISLFRGLSPEQQVRCFAMVAANFGENIRKETKR